MASKITSSLEGMAASFKLNTQASRAGARNAAAVTEEISSRTLRKRKDTSGVGGVDVHPISKTAIQPSHLSEKGGIKIDHQRIKRKKEKDSASVDEIESEGESVAGSETKVGKASSASFLIEDKLKAPMAKAIQTEYNGLVKAAEKVTGSARTNKKISGTGGYVSPADLIAYQIGWGKRVIEWYDTGIQGKMPVMPGDGFTKWSYTELALHFYKAYQYDSSSKQSREFHEVVKRIIEIVEKEHATGNLYKEGVWPWAKLQSGKEWPLSKWVQVNTVAPFKKAAGMIRSAF